MKQSNTVNKQYSISLAYRIIAYILLFSQLFTSCTTHTIVPPAQDPPAGSDVEMTPLDTQANNAGLAGIPETTEHQDEEQYEAAESQGEEEQEEALGNESEQPQEPTPSWRDRAHLLYARVKGAGTLFKEAVTEMSDTNPLQGDTEAQSNEPEDEETQRNTVRRKVKKRRIRQGIMALAAAGIALNLRQSKVALVPTVPVINGKVANTWFTYTYPKSYDSIQGQSANFLHAVNQLRQVVDQLETISACNEYRDWEFLPNVRFHKEAQQTLDTQRAACSVNGKADLSKEFFQIQQQIFNFSGFMKSNLANLTNGWDKPLPPNITSSNVSYPITLPNVTLSDMDTTQILGQLTVFNQSGFYGGPIAGRRLFDAAVTLDDFDDNNRDKKKGIYLICYLPDRKSSNNLYFDGCSKDYENYPVTIAENVQAGYTYLGNLERFLNDLVDRVVVLKQKDCLGFETVLPVDTTLHFKLENKIKDCITKIFIADRESSWLELRPGTAKKMKNCVSFVGLSGVWWKGSFGNWRFVRSFITGIGPSVGYISQSNSRSNVNYITNPAWDNYQMSEEFDRGSFTLTLEADSTKACEDYRAKLAELTSAMKLAQKALEDEREAVRNNLIEYKQKYATLEERQKALVRQYEEKKISIENLQIALEAINRDISNFKVSVNAQKDAIIKSIQQQAESEAALKKEQERIGKLNAELTAKLEDCNTLNVEAQVKQKLYFEQVNQGFDDIEANLTKIVVGNNNILQAIQNQEPVKSWDTSLADQARAREQIIVRQGQLKEEYAQGQEQMLQLFLNASMNSYDRNKQLTALQAQSKRIFDDLQAVNTAIIDSQMLLDNQTNQTQTTVKKIEVAHNRWQNELKVLNQALGKIALEINATKQRLKISEQELNTKTQRIIQCYNDTITFQKSIAKDVNETFTRAIENSIRVRKGLEEELKKFNPEAQSKDQIKTQAELEKEQQKIRDKLKGLMDNAKQTAENINKGLDNAKALNDELWQWNHNFTETMNDHNKIKMYRTMGWFLDRAAGFDKKLCAYINNPTMRNTAETFCNVDSAFSNYLGSLDNSYLQIPNSVRWLYFDFRPQGKNIFQKLNTTYSMQLQYYQRAYKDMDRAFQEYSIRIANLGRTIYGQPVDTYFKSQVNASLVQMDADVQDFIQANENSISAFLNGFPRLLSVSNGMHIIKTLAWATQQNRNNPVIASEILAYGSKISIVPALSLLIYSLNAPVKQYSIGSFQMNRNPWLTAETAFLVGSSLFINIFSEPHVHPTIERLISLVGGAITTYQFWNLPEVKVTSVVPSCLPNLPPQKLAATNDRINANLAANVLSDVHSKNLPSYVEDVLSDSIGSVPPNASAPLFNHCNEAAQHTAEEKVKGMILTFMQVHNSITLLSHVVAVLKGHSYQPLTTANYVLFLARCTLPILSKVHTQMIDFNISVPQVGALELFLAAFVISMSVKGTSKTVQKEESQTAPIGESVSPGAATEEIELQPLLPAQAADSSTDA